MSDDDENTLSLEEAFSLLKVPDFIMEPRVERVLSAYLSNGGTTEAAIDALSHGYMASAQMANMMCGWLVALGVEPRPIELIPVEDAKTEEQIKEEEEKKKKPPPKKGRGRAKKEKEEKKSEKTESEEAATSCIEGSLASILSRHFRPDCADGIFEEEGGVEWLPELIAHKRWRDVVYELIESHPQCMMLNFSIKLISDAGYQTEISSLNSAAQQLEIFSRVFITSLDIVLREHKNSTNTDKYDSAFSDLVRVCSHSEHCYVYATALLENLARQENDMVSATCVHVIESMRMAMKGKEHETTSMRCAMLNTADDQLAEHLVDSILLMTSRGELNPADISHVYQQYILPHPPAIDVIRDPMLTEMLVDSLFHCDGPKVNLEHRDKYVFLLAYAASVSEHTKNGRRTQIRVELDAVRAAIERAASSLETCEDILSELPDLLRECRVAVVASGILHYVGTLLLSETRLGDAPPWTYVLIDHSVSLHPNLHSIAFELCCDLYMKVSGDNEAAEVIMERQRAVVDRFVHLLSVGAALPVLEKITTMFRDALIDVSLVRYFAIEVLDIIAPPYSRELCLLLYPLVSDQDMFDRLLCERNPAVVDFLNYCTSTFKEPPFVLPALLPPVTTTS